MPLTNIKKAFSIGAFALAASFGIAAEPTDSVSASFIRDVYHNGNFVHYVEALNDYIVYEGNYSGQWSDADRLLFSINGNPYSMNRYYLDGIRLDNRFTPGSTLYVPNIEHYNMQIGLATADIEFTRDPVDSRYLLLQGNVGGIGGISSGSEKIIHLFHRAGWEGAYRPEVTIPYRPHIRHAFSCETAFSLPSKWGKEADYHLFATYGSRAIPRYDADGLLAEDPLYNSPYYKVQFDGRYSFDNSLLKEAGFYINLSGKKDDNSEIYYNWEEVSRLTTFSATVFGKGMSNGHKLNAALTYSLNNRKHDNICFERNVIDQDGESMEPFEPDGTNHELTLFVGYEKKLTPHLKLIGEAYNSIIRFNPSTRSFFNEIYCKLPDPIESHFPEGEFQPIKHERVELMRYFWTTSPFTGGLLDNQISAKFEKRFSRKFNLQASLGMSIDGFLLGGGRSKVSPNFLAGVEATFVGSRHFDISLAITHDRIRYNINDLRFFSRDYLNGEAYSATTNDLMLTTGGRYHALKSGLRQPAFVGIDIPVHIYFDRNRRHELALIQTYRKYYNTWYTSFGGDAGQYGRFVDDVFYYNRGEKYYTVGYLPSGAMGNNFFTDSPYYFSQLTRYTYHGDKVFVSLSWQSLQMGCLSALGIGPVANNVGVLSESTANPNTSKVMDNPSPYSGAGRGDQDKGFVLRMYASYNISRMFQVGVNLKWTDGQPFTHYHTELFTDEAGNRQVAIVPARSRGTNPIDGDFGERENAIFNIDLHARMQWRWLNRDMSLMLLCYNIFDFGNSINEYSFNEGLNDNRADMILNIPRGLLLTYQIKL